MRVTFGKYIPMNSIIHKMDSRMKLVMIISLITAVFFPIGFSGYILLSIFIFGIFAFSKLPVKILFNLVWTLIFIFIIIFLVNIIIMKPLEDMSKIDNIIKIITENKISNIKIVKSNSTIQGFVLPGADIQGTNVIGRFFNWKFLWFSEKAVFTSLIMTWRIYLMITLTCILTGTTQPLSLTLAIEDLMTPLKLIRVPIHILSMIISIALRMIPTLIDEAGRIIKAQSSRGMDIKNGKFKDKGKAMVSLIIPLLVSSFQRAEDLAYAMETRGYSPYAERNRYIKFSFKWLDLFIMILGLSVCIFMIVYTQLPDSLVWVKPLYIDNLLSI